MRCYTMEAKLHKSMGVILNSNGSRNLILDKECNDLLTRECFQELLYH